MRKETCFAYTESETEFSNHFWCACGTFDPHSKLNFLMPPLSLVSHFCIHEREISPLYSAMPRETRINEIPPLLQRPLVAIGPSLGQARRGYKRDGSRCREKHSVAGVLLHLHRDRGSSLLSGTLKGGYYTHGTREYTHGIRHEHKHGPVLDTGTLPATRPKYVGNSLL